MLFKCFIYNSPSGIWLHGTTCGLCTWSVGPLCGLLFLNNNYYHCLLHGIVKTIIANPFICQQKKLTGLHLNKDILSLCISLTRLSEIWFWLELLFPMGICTLPLEVYFNE